VKFKIKIKRLKVSAKVETSGRLLTSN
jgi:hypothetical protein